MQGRVPAGAAGLPLQPHVIGQAGETGGFRVHRYVDRDGRECAYYDTTLLFPTNALSLSGEPTGVAVLDMTDPAKPVHTTTLVTPAMQSPHESLNISVQRGLLAAVMGNPALRPGVRRRLRHQPATAATRSSWPAARRRRSATRAGWRPTARPSTRPRSAPTTRPRSTSPTRGCRARSGRASSTRTACRSPTTATAATSRPATGWSSSTSPRSRRASRTRRCARSAGSSWSNMTIPQVAIPVTIKRQAVPGRDRRVLAGRGGRRRRRRNGPRVGAARIIDISDETQAARGLQHPARGPPAREPRRDRRRLRARRARCRATPGTTATCRSGRAGHPGLLDDPVRACGCSTSAIRSTRGDRLPRGAAVDDLARPAAPIIDERANYAMSQPAFAPERGEIWYSDGTSGFYALRMDPGVWPFPVSRGAGGCVERDGFASVSARPRGRGVEVSFARRVERPVRVDVVRASDGAASRAAQRAVHVAGRAPGRLRRAVLDGRRPPGGRARPRRGRALPRPAVAPAPCELRPGAQLRASGDRCSAGR